MYYIHFLFILDKFLRQFYEEIAEFLSGYAAK